VVRELWRVARKYVVHLDWFEDYLKGYQTGWCWLHDYQALWKALGASPMMHRMASTGIQTAFIIPKTISEHESSSR